MVPARSELVAAQMVEEAALAALLSPSSLKKSRKKGYMIFMTPGSDFGERDRVMFVEALPGNTTLTVMPLGSSSFARNMDMDSRTLFEWV